MGYSRDSTAGTVDARRCPHWVDQDERRAAVRWHSANSFGSWGGEVAIQLRKSSELGPLIARVRKSGEFHFFGRCARGREMIVWNEIAGFVFRINYFFEVAGEGVSSWAGKGLRQPR